MTVLVDSDVLIEVACARDLAVVQRWVALSQGSDLVVCSPVSVAELWHGARPNEHAALRELFASLVCVPIDASVGYLAGAYLREFRKSHGVELGDALIAAAAVRSGAELWTRNRKHFPMTDIAFYGQV